MSLDWVRTQIFEPISTEKDVKKWQRALRWRDDSTAPEKVVSLTILRRQTLKNDSSKETKEQQLGEQKSRGRRKSGF